MSQDLQYFLVLVASPLAEAGPSTLRSHNVPVHGIANELVSSTALPLPQHDSPQPSAGAPVALPESAILNTTFVAATSSEFTAAVETAPSKNYGFLVPKAPRRNIWKA